MPGSAALPAATLPAKVQCCIAGGGPAGLMLGLILARAGVSVLVLEKHADFLRDFRGDTIHPSTMEVMSELGLLDDFLKLPHAAVAQLTAQFGEERLQLAEFSRLPTRAKFIAMMPQWDFLNFLARESTRYPTYNLAMSAEATGLSEEGGRVTGVSGRRDGAGFTVAADLVVACDGRHSALREASGLGATALTDIGAPMDVLWFKLPRLADDSGETMGRFDAGRIFVMFDRTDYWQCAFVIPKGANDKVRASGLDAFRASVAKLVPFEGSRTAAITDWDQVKLLTVAIDRLETWWRPGFLCIGDAAHAMSPVGGVGVNLAVQDAVAAANILAPALQEGRVSDAHLAAVQARRAFPTRMTQRLQVMMQNAVIAPALVSRGSFKPPLAIRLIAGIPLLRRIPARLIGMGVRPEHVAAKLRK